MSENGKSPSPAMMFLWPALAAASASSFAAAIARDLVNLATVSEPKAGEPAWTTPNRVALELGSLRLRDFSTAASHVPTLICAPYALHGAVLTDLAPDHSLVAALRAAGLANLFVTDWRSAQADMRSYTIDTYLADLNVVIDTLGGAVDLIGLCQGGWMALVYAARFPGKVRKLVVAGAPIDLAAGESRLSRLAAETPTPVFEELVALGDGRVLGRRALRFWGPEWPDTEGIRRLLQTPVEPGTPAFDRLEARFRDWYQCTLDLPGTYYLQVVEWLFKENRLATGDFVALGQRIDLSCLRHPLFLLATSDDDTVAPVQTFAAEGLVGTPPSEIVKLVAPCGHLGLFFARGVLSGEWPQVARWLTEREPARSAA